MLAYEFWGNTLKNWGLSIITIVVTIIVAKLIATLFRKIIIPFFQKRRSNWGDIIVYSIGKPIVFGIVLLGLWIAIHRLAYHDHFVKVVDVSYRILVVLNITWLFARCVSRIIDIYWVNSRGSNTHKVSVKMIPIVKRTVLVIVWAIGLIMALGNVGINISALLGTLGIGGIAFALAAQDTIKNIFSAFTILADKPFGIGDTIKIDSFEGTIVDVGIRSTRMMTYDKRIVTFPNYKISDASVENISTEPMRRVVIKLGVDYSTTADKMNEALEMLRGIPEKVKFVSANGVVAYFSDFRDTAMVITFVFFIEKKGDTAQVSSNVNMEILSGFNAAEIRFASPMTTVILPK